jgi:1-pyrroline-5-carboxylate dehydrogenase
MDSADLEAAAEGVMRSAFGLQNQKCSATSRVYVHRAVAAPFVECLLEKTAAMTIGDPTARDVYFGPVINERAVARFEQAWRRPRGRASCSRAAGVSPKAPSPAATMWRRQSPGSPWRARCSRRSCSCRCSRSGGRELDAAIAEANRVEYGLTAGIFTGNQGEIDRFFDEVQAGVCYANKRSGATTGAWPGAQPFCGWKGSGSTGKGGCGPYYVAQFMREQSRTVITT